jgi:Mlc titration factor MtfA (ptsG expression regulator)
LFSWLPWSKTRRRARLVRSPWPEHWSLHLNRNVRLTWNLSDQERQRLHNLVKVFIGEKHWEGCDGLTLTEEMKVTVAANACLMLLGVKDFYFDNVRTILLYPQVFSRRARDGHSAGTTEHRSGEAWQGGPIILSWKNALQGGRNEDDGQNVVIHEFAHALDGLDGQMGGNVMFPDADQTEQWEQVVNREYQSLSQAAAAGRHTLLDHYGATNRAEFFAVASETFFELPHEMQREHADLFRLLSAYYQVDPRQWQRRH